MPTPFNPGLLTDRGFVRDPRSPVDPATGAVSAVRPIRVAPAVEPVTPEPTPVQIGSPMNTLYGIDSESYLTPDQQKLARMIQGKFTLSGDRRNRELQRYGAPMLSSFVEDESLARAMAQAQGLNYRPPAEPQAPLQMRPSAPFTPFGNTGGARVPTLPVNEAPAKNNPAQWQRILSGLASIAPLLFGKDAYGQFLNKGLLGTIIEKVYGSGASSVISPEQLEKVVMSTNPFTGMPLDMSNTPVPTIPSDPGYNWGWGDQYDAVMNTPGIAGGTFGDAFSNPMSWADWGWGSGAGDISNYVDLFGGV